MLKRKHLHEKITEDVAAIDVWDGPQREMPRLVNILSAPLNFRGIQRH